MNENTTLPTLPWTSVSPEFEFDGSWRDIYVFGTSSADWTRLLRGLSQSSYALLYTRGGAQMEVPLEAGAAFPLAGGCDRLLRINVAGVQVNTHFFEESEIEFDIDPREVTGQRRFDELIGFMCWLAELLGKDVVLTPENCPTGAIFRVRPGGCVVHCEVRTV